MLSESKNIYVNLNEQNYLLKITFKMYRIGEHKKKHSRFIQFYNIALYMIYSNIRIEILC